MRCAILHSTRPDGHKLVPDWSNEVRCSPGRESVVCRFVNAVLDVCGEKVCVCALCACVREGDLGSQQAVNR